MLHQGDRIQQHINPRLFVFLYQHTHTDWAGVMRRPIPHIVIDRITSYNVCYTKLLRVQHSGVWQVLREIVNECLAVAAKAGVVPVGDVWEGIERIPRTMAEQTRITSYNVCYTKLLRLLSA